MAVFLDSGATLTLLPTKLANEIAADFGAETTNTNGFYSVDCQFNNQSGALNFAFDGVTIRVPYREIVREIQTGFGTQCFLGISPSEDFALLGDSMLRSAYGQSLPGESELPEGKLIRLTAVFDQTNNAIHLAQYSNCGSNEKEITAQMDLGKITGDCEAPDSDAVDATSDPLSSGGNTGTGSTGSADSDSGASMWEIPGLEKWLKVWVILYTIDFVIGFLL